MFQLHRSSTGMVFGVCGGLAERLGVDPTWVRLAFLAGTLFGGSALVVYLVLAGILPTQPSLPESEPDRTP